jgi:hypothetical protein
VQGSLRCDFNDLEFRCQDWDDVFPGVGQAAARRGGLAVGILEDNFLPPFPDRISNVEFPVDSFQEGHFIGVNLTNLEAGNLAPGSGRVVAVLQVLRGKDECREEHATTALQSAKRCIFGLGHGEVMLGKVSLDKNQVVKGNL